MHHRLSDLFGGVTFLSPTFLLAAYRFCFIMLLYLNHLSQPAQEKCPHLAERVSVSIFFGNVIRARERGLRDYY